MKVFSALSAVELPLENEINHKFELGERGWIFGLLYEAKGKKKETFANVYLQNEHSEPILV